MYDMISFSLALRKAVAMSIWCSCHPKRAARAMRILNPVGLATAA